MANRRVTILLFPLTLAITLAAACSDATRYRVLTFFFDGVPPGGTEPAQPDTTPSDTDTPTPGETPAPARRAVVIHAHKPYRDNRCGVCHSIQTGQLFKTPQEGLCTDCHTDVPGDVRYAHGPIAVRDCLFCHHHHGTEFPRLLRDNPRDICLRCHDADDLNDGTHHADRESRACTDCHHAHGGHDRFFLKRTQP